MLQYQIYKSTRNDRTRGLYYARAVHTEEINLEGLGEIIQRNCSMKRSDVMAVLTELCEVMSDSLQDGKIVKIDGLGRFKITMKTTGAESAKDWNPEKNLTRLKCYFLPAGKKLSSGKLARNFLSGTHLREQSQYTTVTPAPPASQG